MENQTTDEIWKPCSRDVPEFVPPRVMSFAAAWRRSHGQQKYEWHEVENRRDIESKEAALRNIDYIKHLKSKAVPALKACYVVVKEDQDDDFNTYRYVIGVFSNKKQALKYLLPIIEKCNYTADLDYFLEVFQGENLVYDSEIGFYGSRNEKWVVLDENGNVKSKYYCWDAAELAVIDHRNVCDEDAKIIKAEEYYKGEQP